MASMDCSMIVGSELFTTLDEPNMPKALCSLEKDNWLASISEEVYTWANNRTRKFKSFPPPVTCIIPNEHLQTKNSYGLPPPSLARIISRENFKDIILDYLELYALVKCIELVHMLLAILISMGLNVDQMDLTGKFRHAMLARSI